MGYREELLGLSGDIGGREVVARHPDDVLEVAVSSEGVIININTMADYHSRLPGEAKP
jgi:CTP:molybdopterin cytidylyltransferase MocA